MEVPRFEAKLFGDVGLSLLLVSCDIGVEFDIGETLPQSSLSEEYLSRRRVRPVLSTTVHPPSPRS